MELVEPPLEDLRKEIDRIDRAIVGLLIERTDVVRSIGEIKGDRVDGRLAMRPAREAVILRRLVAQAGDRFPQRVLVRMWRELLAATTRQQTPVALAVYAPGGRSLGSGTSRAIISARPRRSPAPRAPARRSAR